MPLISDKRIRELCEHSLIAQSSDPEQPPMITPFHAGQVREADGVPRISYGVSSYGYDVSLAEEFYLFSNHHSKIYDPKRPDPTNLIKLDPIQEDGETYVVVPGNSFILGRLSEQFNMPRNVTAIALSKSTYVRAGLAICITPIEAGFIGSVVVEIMNASSIPVKLYANEGIAQLLFFEEEPCETSYADRNGKYQYQTGVQLSKV